ncbi:hypothetical protein ABZ863_17520 [Saccharomonospora sp. NPDC046836]|uniref:hypothetical protein n=1 Tax=Saccharomonospora sp. NPDC046836 TaxID=3156921 RepID=UPI0033E009BD
MTSSQEQQRGGTDGERARAEALHERWRGQTLHDGWPQDMRWEVPATQQVVNACLTGTGLHAALRTLADERFDEATSPAEFERDIDSLAICLIGQDTSTVNTGQLRDLAHRAAHSIITEDNVLAQLIDPTTELRTRTAFLCDLTGAGYRHERVYVWTARWPAGAPPWSETATRIAVAAQVLAILGPRDSASYLGPRTLSALLTAPERRRELEQCLHGLSQLGTFETTMVECAQMDWPVWARWIVEAFPELIDEPLP